MHQPAGAALSDTVAIVRLGGGDAEKARAINRLFGDVFEDPASYALAPPTDDYLQSSLALDHVIALGAFAGDEAIGALVAYELPKLEQARSEIYIYDLAVDPRWRRRGIATGMIDRLHAIAAEIGAWVTYVQADHGDEAAIALYTKLGTREDVMHFDLDPARGGKPRSKG